MVEKIKGDFWGRMHRGPNICLFNSDNPDLEIPWALRTPLEYLDGKQPEVQILWLNKGSTDFAFENRLFRLATDEIG